MALGSIDTGPALNSLSYYQQQLATVSAQASSGNRLVNASIDPSGLAIYNALESQAQGSDTANQNISQASDAINVAQGATSGIQDALGKLQNLAIEAEQRVQLAERQRRAASAGERAGPADQRRREYGQLQRHGAPDRCELRHHAGDHRLGHDDQQRHPGRRAATSSRAPRPPRARPAARSASRSPTPAPAPWRT